MYSYGHDIETAWLTDRGLEVLNDDVYTAKLSPITREITKNIYDRAYKDSSLLNEGFLNGYQKEPSCEYYLEAAKDIWAYIRDYLIDKRNGSEWYWALDADRHPLEKPIVEPWKCPYHNGRMCMEVIRRLQSE